MRDMMPSKIFDTLQAAGKFKAMDDALHHGVPGVDSFVHFFHNHSSDNYSTVGQCTWFMSNDPSDPSFQIVFYKFEAEFNMDSYLGFITTGGKSVNVTWYDYKYHVIDMDNLQKIYDQQEGPAAIKNWLHGSSKY